MSDPQLDAIGDDGQRLTGEIDRSDPGNPNVRLEAGCNEFWLSFNEAKAVRDYLHEAIPFLRRGGEDEPVPSAKVKDG